MGLTKDNQYSPDQLKLAQLGKAIGHPARVKILELLNEETIVRFDHLDKLLNLSQPTIRVHLEKLKECNLIQEGYIFHCSLLTLNKENFDQITLIFNLVHNSKV